jgi:DNA-directed RNA polymerase subunit N (RpoN/RPB10)
MSRFDRNRFGSDSVCLRNEPILGFSAGYAVADEYTSYQSEVVENTPTLLHVKCKLVRFKKRELETVLVTLGGGTSGPVLEFVRYLADNALQENHVLQRTFNRIERF